MVSVAEQYTVIIDNNPSLRMWRDIVHEFMDEKIGVEYCRECYANREYPHRIYDGVVENDWIGLLVPEEYGGQGGDMIEQVILLEALGKYGYDLGIPVAISSFSYGNLVEYGTEEQKQRFIPKLLDGEVRFSIGVSESGTGSDAASLQTRAERDGDHYVVNGEKMWQSAAHVDGNVITLYVRTDPDAEKHEGISALLVPNDLDGIEMTKLDTVVRKATGTNQVFFDDVRVPAENRLGAEGQGWEILTDHFANERTQISAAMVGNAQTVVDTALEYALEREQFGTSIAEFQTIKHRLADMQTEVDAARQLVYHAAEHIDHGSHPRRLAAQAKLKASETFQTVAQQGMQIMGGAGFLPENDMERYWREGKISTIGGGTSEIQRSIIASDMLENR